MVSLFIYSTCILFVFGLFPTALQALSQAKFVFMANQVARQEMEYLKNLDWYTLKNFAEIIKSDPEKFYRTSVMECEINGVKSVTTFESCPMITTYEQDGNGEPEILNIRVLVKYRYGSGIKKEADEYYKSVHLETLVRKPRKYL